MSKESVQRLNRFVTNFRENSDDTKKAFDEVLNYLKAMQNEAEKRTSSSNELEPPGPNRPASELTAEAGEPRDHLSVGRAAAISFRRDDKHAPLQLANDQNDSAIKSYAGQDDNLSQKNEGSDEKSQRYPHE